MHEYSVAAALLELVEAQARQHGASRVVAVHVRIGEQAGVEHELLRSAWELVREPGPAADARLALHAVPVRWTCRRCGAAVALDVALRCAACGGAPRLASGDELLLERIEMEVDGHV